VRQSERFDPALTHAFTQWLIIIWLAVATVFVLHHARDHEEPPTKDWCRDQFGTDRPQEHCDD